ncbi:MAG: HAD-IC family P-type ATPase [Thermoanaerobaculaceae bacterium]
MEKIIANFHAAALRTAMLTGDNPRTGSAVAKQLEIDDVRAGLNPEDKVAAVRQLEERCGPVLMVGDRVHDAPALAAATCGVAMGAAGSDAAIEAADVALMADDWAKVQEALLLGKKARLASVQNIVFSPMVLATMIALALLGALGWRLRCCSTRGASFWPCLRAGRLVSA